MNILAKLDYIKGLVDETESVEDDKAKAAVQVLQFHAEAIARALLEVAYTPDSVVREVQNKLVNRSRRGMETYGVTMAANPVEVSAWIDHTVEELLDAANYLTRLKQDVR